MKAIKAVHFVVCLVSSEPDPIDGENRLSENAFRLMFGAIVVCLVLFGGMTHLAGI